MTFLRLAILIVAVAPAALTAQTDSLEGRSLLGAPLYRPSPTGDARRVMEARLDSARAEMARRPSDPEALIWVGRRTAYLGRYAEARAIFSEGVRRFPSDARFLRHRGHRYLSVRLLDSAIADFTRAWTLTRGKPDEIEPDGLPNARGVPTSTLQTNICYHLGLAYFLKGDFARALPVYEECDKLSTNPDMLVATRYWHYMTLRRLGRDRDAAALIADIGPSLDIIENGAYHRLLLLNKGALPLNSLVARDGAGVSALDAAVTDATLWYGIGSWHLYNGRRREAEQVFRRIVAGPAWSAFGYIAAEAELARR